MSIIADQKYGISGVLPQKLNLGNYTVINLPDIENGGQNPEFINLNDYFSVVERNFLAANNINFRISGTTQYKAPGGKYSIKDALAAAPSNQLRSPLPDNCAGGDDGTTFSWRLISNFNRYDMPVWDLQIEVYGCGDGVNVHNVTNRKIIIDHVF